MYCTLLTLQYERADAVLTATRARQCICEEKKQLFSIPKASAALQDVEHGSSLTARARQ
jgi:hypothetical protein